MAVEHKIKILYLINSLEMGGAERVVVDLVNGVNPAYFEPTICCLRETGSCASRIQRQGVEVIQMRHLEGSSPLVPISRPIPPSVPSTTGQLSRG